MAAMEMHRREPAQQAGHDGAGCHRADPCGPSRGDGAEAAGGGPDGHEVPALHDGAEGTASEQCGEGDLHRQDGLHGEHG
ncbi:hypothetical protein ACQPXB_28145 [Amycolatopsis sp. CA-161197]|uniref:hypothetical protein n=1 Tax=Amycolatopsis sp. CA-161197 TaxID=3239922 RepID=UPI003D8A7C38